MVGPSRRGTVAGTPTRLMSTASQERKGSKLLTGEMHARCVSAFVCMTSKIAAIKAIIPSNYVNNGQ